jgi:hypothetical protein
VENRETEGETLVETLESPHPKDCDCGGTGWVEVEDVIVGAMVATRCPGPDHERQLTLWEGQ